MDSNYSTRDFRHPTTAGSTGPRAVGKVCSVKPDVEEKTDNSIEVSKPRQTAAWRPLLLRSRIASPAEKSRYQPPQRGLVLRRGELSVLGGLPDLLRRQSPGKDGFCKGAAGKDATQLVGPEQRDLQRCCLERRPASGNDLQETRDTRYGSRLGSDAQAPPRRQVEGSVLRACDAPDDSSESNLVRDLDDSILFAVRPGSADFHAVQIWRVTPRAEFGLPPGGSMWRVDHTSSAINHLSDGKWHNVMGHWSHDDAQDHDKPMPT